MSSLGKIWRHERWACLSSVFNQISGSWKFCSFPILNIKPLPSPELFNLIVNHGKRELEGTSESHLLQTSAHGRIIYSKTVSSKRLSNLILTTLKDGDLTVFLGRYKSIAVLDIFDHFLNPQERIVWNICHPGHKGEGDILPMSLQNQKVTMALTLKKIFSVSQP